jgi:hypothetical protein
MPVSLFIDALHGRLKEVVWSAEAMNPLVEVGIGAAAALFWESCLSKS